MKRRQRRERESERYSLINKSNIGMELEGFSQERAGNTPSNHHHPSLLEAHRFCIHNVNTSLNQIQFAERGRGDAWETRFQETMGSFRFCELLITTGTYKYKNPLLGGWMNVRVRFRLLIAAPPKSAWIVFPIYLVMDELSNYCTFFALAEFSWLHRILPCLPPPFFPYFFLGPKHHRK